MVKNYIYYKIISYSYNNDIMNLLFKIKNNQINNNLFKIVNDEIKYYDYPVNIYLGFNIYNNSKEEYYNYFYNILDYKLNYIANNINNNDYKELCNYDIKDNDLKSFICLSNSICETE